MYRVGNGSVRQARLQSAGNACAPDTLINMTGESIKTTVEKGEKAIFWPRRPATRRM